MTLVNRTWAVTADTEVSQAPGSPPSNRGNGKGNYMTVGVVSGHTNVSLLAVDISDRVGIATMLHAWLRLTVAGQQCATRGANVCIWFEATTTFAEGSFGQDCQDDNNNATVWPGPNGLVADRVKYNPASNPGTGDVLKIDLVAMVRTAIAAGASKLYVRLTSADTGSSAYDINNPARTVTFYTIQAGSGKRPHMDIEGDDAYVPLSPTQVTPATTDPGGPAEKPTQVPTTFSVGFTYVSGGQQGDYVNAAEFRLYTATATDNDTGGILTGAEQKAGITGTGTQSGYATGTVTGTFGPVKITDASLIGKELRGRLRLQGRSGKWSPWTRLLPTTVGGTLTDPGMRIIPNSPPAAPTNLVLDTTSTSPDYSGTHVDPDPGSSVSEVQTQVWKQTSSGIEVIENNTSYHPESPDHDSPTSGAGGLPSTITGTGGQAVAGGTAWTVAHTGRQLVIGESIRRRHRTVDQYGAVGKFSEVQTWIVGQAVGPTIIPAPGVKRDSLTPLVGASFNQAFTAIEIEAYGSATSPVALWLPGQITIPSASSYTLPYGSVGTAVDLTWGQIPWIRARVLVNGFWTPWSDRSPVTINSLPRKPIVSVLGAVLNPVDGGYWTVASLTPRILTTFVDPDLPNDSPTSRTVNIWSHPRGASPINSAVSVSGFTFRDVPAGVMVWERSYEIDVTFADTSGVSGTRSDPYVLKASQAPVVTAGPLPDPADPTPVISWNFASPSGKPQLGATIEIYGPELP